MDYRYGTRRLEGRNASSGCGMGTGGCGRNSGCCVSPQRTAPPRCEHHSISIDAPIGMAYVPSQKFSNVYDWETGFSRGTIFSALDKPFLFDSCSGRCRR